MQNYLANIKNLKNDKKELGSLILTGVISYIFLCFFISSYSNSGFDMPAEFAGYLMLFSFLLFLFINFLGINSNVGLSRLRCLSFIQLLFAITNFLILKLLIAVIFKQICFFVAMFLFLRILCKIKKFGEESVS